MAVRRQPLSILQDENAEIHRGKTAMARAPQVELSARKTLSNITNKPKPGLSSGFVTPITSRKGGIDSLRPGTENTNGGFNFMVDAEFLAQGAKSGALSSAKKGGVPREVAEGAKSGAFSSAKKDRGMARDPLRNITNVDPSQGFKASTASVKKKMPDSRPNGLKFGPNPKYAVTEEMKWKADAWAREGIEKVHFTGRDMEALRAKIQEEEVNRRVEQALSYRTDLPCFLPRALEEDPPDITDILELDVVEDLPKMVDSLCHEEELWMPILDYKESFLECSEILQSVSKDWPVLVEYCVR